MFGLFRTKYDLQEESKRAGFEGNVKHLKSDLIHCPRNALEKYGPSKYLELKKESALFERAEETAHKGVERASGEISGLSGGEEVGSIPRGASLIFLGELLPL